MPNKFFWVLFKGARSFVYQFVYLLFYTLQSIYCFIYRSTHRYSLKNKSCTKIQPYNYCVKLISVYLLLLSTVFINFSKVHFVIVKRYSCYALRVWIYIQYVQLLFSCSVVSDSLQPHGLQPARLLCPGDFPGKNTRVGCHLLLQ